ncbi:MAG: hypothetical protein R3B91_14985 [Planctomycetaceae bacterium]
MRDRDEHVEGLKQEHELEILLDRARVELFTLQPPNSNAEHAAADAHLNARIPVTAGPACGRGDIREAVVLTTRNETTAV